jgi:hypothetical protein
MRSGRPKPVTDITSGGTHILQAVAIAYQTTSSHGREIGCVPTTCDVPDRIEEHAT